ncbi:MAG: UDP-N-acetylglucosamine 2-epimerase (non-hydrolyzing) [Anaerolineae bacterium]|nr:UDP-N-acetylglucosamine 2-epimerase (non-hydrolyzing) [Anaerolineae bacterium]
MAPVIRELERRSAACSEHSRGACPEHSRGACPERSRGACPERSRRVVQSFVWVTAQHRQMLDQVLHLFGIQPDLDLNIMQDGQTPTQVAARVLQSLEPHLARERPDWILIQGDTTTVMATAIAAHHLQIKIGHVEAGLRTHDKHNPFPEEMNRVIADALSDLHFAPTRRARENLLREGISDATIRVTGNTVIDALQWIVQQPPTSEVRTLLTHLGLPLDDDTPTQRTDARLLLVTAHRRENFGQPIRNICTALREIATARRDVRIVYPVHLNPNVQQPVRELLSNVPNIALLPPVDYLTLVHLLKRCYLVLTDSGGLQEEAPSFGKPVLVLRETTERPEAIDAGTAKIVGTDTERIVHATYRLLDDADAYAAMAHAINPFGDGRAAERIVEALLE